MTRPITVAALLLATGTVVGGCSASVSINSEERDLEAVRAVADAYVDGWLQNDPDAVLATLAPDAVLMPLGHVPVQGEEAIREYWWPAAGPATQITRYADSIDELEVDGDLAYVRGSAEFRFTWGQDGETVEQASKSAYLMTLRRDGGTWRINNRMWGRLPD